MISEEFRALFESIGQIESCKLLKDKLTHQNLGFGFVNYARPEDAEKAIKTLNGLKIENKMIKVSYARPSSDSIKGANLYVCGLPKNWSIDDMNECFSQYGKIITSRILYNSSNGQSKGVGFIRFDLKSEADLAIYKLNGKTPEGHVESLTVKYANCGSIFHSKYMPTSSVHKQNSSTVSLNSACRNLNHNKQLNNSSLLIPVDVRTSSDTSQLHPNIVQQQLKYDSVYNYMPNMDIFNTEQYRIQSVINPTESMLQPINMSAGFDPTFMQPVPRYCIFVYNVDSAADMNAKTN